MHTDPGPYWDWEHYFTLLGKPVRAATGRRGGLVTIRPDYAATSRCTRAVSSQASPARRTVRVRSGCTPQPADDAPLVKDIGLRPDGQDSTTGVNDTGARASTGQQYAVPERDGDWTAIWYLGQKAWFHNPAQQPTAVNARESRPDPEGRPGGDPRVRPRLPGDGRLSRRACRSRPVSPLPYKLLAGQKYAAGDRVPGEYFYAPTFDATATPRRARQGHVLRDPVRAPGGLREGRGCARPEVAGGRHRSRGPVAHRLNFVGLCD